MLEGMNWTLDTKVVMIVKFEREVVIVATVPSGEFAEGERMKRRAAVQSFTA